MVEPGMLIRGRHIRLRAQAPQGNGVLSLKLVEVAMINLPPLMSASSF